MELNELAAVLKKRRSIRKWQDKPVPEELLTQAVELATWAPNGGNQQNWHFYIITKKQTINAIADAVQKRADQMASWPEAEKFGMVTPSGRRPPSFFRAAPAAIAVAASRYQSSADQFLAKNEAAQPDAVKMRQWRNTADSRVQSVAAAITYLTLALHQMGLGSLWMTGPLQAKEEIEKILKVPDSLDVIAFLPIGYPDESPDPPARRPFNQVSEIIR